MNPLVAKLITEINNHEDEAFVGAGMVAEVFHNHTAQPIPPYDELLKAEPLAQSDVESLERALVTYIQSNPPRLASAVAALAKFHDPALASLFRDLMSHELSALLEHNRALNNLIIALDNLGEMVIASGSQSPMEIDNSVAQARKYLKKYGIIIPW